MVLPLGKTGRKKGKAKAKIETQIRDEDRKECLDSRSSLKVKIAMKHGLYCSDSLKLMSSCLKESKSSINILKM